MNLLTFTTAIVKNPAFQPRNGSTFCNFATQLIAEGIFGTDSLNGLTANQIHAKISKEWRKVSAEDAVNFAKHSFVIASQAGEKHGHVATVLPLPMVSSGKWGPAVPVCANVGVKNGIMGVNFAFSSEPEYFTKP
jgi:hypothetical protein